ncbi:hypothetical protein ACJMK2_029967 [Sinanodonta woodiana]|uniref:Helicase C-terminal domain-containing protein n=1 Tax=Sinanodonta woodiana TaxID=1069815 RepID=A0ABD3XFH4_SINWO
MDCKKPDETACVVQFHSQQSELQKLMIQLCGNILAAACAQLRGNIAYDLKHVKRVIHAGPPTTLEAYTQAIGRTGRGGSRAQAILLYNATGLAQRYYCCDICANYKQFVRPTIIPSLEQRNQVMQTMKDYMSADGTGCFDEHISYLISETLEI